MKQPMNTRCPGGPPPLDGNEEHCTPPMLVNEISRLFTTWMRANFGETTGVMSQNSAKLIMHCLAIRDGVSQLELVRATSLKPPTVSITLKKMEEAGLVRHTVNRSDQRAVQVYLTEKGRGHNSYVHENLERADRLLMQNFTEEEYRTAKAILLRMRNNILKDLCADGIFSEAPHESLTQRGKETTDKK